MPFVHLANTNFEFELAQNSPSAASLVQSWSQHPLCLQLQFLPLLYGEPEDWIAVTGYPSQSFLDQLSSLEWHRQSKWPRLVLLDEPKSFEGLTCQAWGASRSIQEWAKTRQISYPAPENWDMIRQVNSKTYSFLYRSLDEAALLSDERDLKDWLKQVPGKKVLKTCFGLSGKGNRIIDGDTPFKSLIAFCLREWKEGRPVIAEPWVDRCFDFSTQWFLSSEGSSQLIGSTVFETNPSGTYLGTLAGSEEILFGDFLPFLQAHKEAVQPILKDLACKGFFGYLGIDALLYRSKDQKVCLYPVVEINARQTMSLVALRMQRKWFEDQPIRLEFALQSDKRPSLLPLTLPSSGIQFKRKLVLSLKAR